MQLVVENRAGAHEHEDASDVSGTRLRLALAQELDEFVSIGDKAGPQVHKPRMRAEQLGCLWTKRWPLDPGLETNDRIPKGVNCRLDGVKRLSVIFRKQPCAHERTLAGGLDLGRGGVRRQTEYEEWILIVHGGPVDLVRSPAGERAKVRNVPRYLQKKSGWRILGLPFVK